MVLVCAPPGFGKSFALSQWYSTAKADGVHSAWLGIDATDNPATVVQYLAFACHLSGLDVARTGLLTRGHVSVCAALGVQSLLSCIEQTAMPWLLIIDDAESASGEVVGEVLYPLTRFFPANLTLGLASRDPAFLDLAELSQRGLLVPIGPDLLRFDRDEVQKLWGRSATRSQVRTVEQRSGGWPALLQLMLEHGSTPHFDTTATPACGATAVSTFIETRLLARMKVHLRDALLRLSLLEHFTSILAKELIDEAEVEQVLARLTALGVLGQSNDKSGVTFAVHPLLRRYLADRFVAEQPTKARDLNQKAARSYLRLGNFVQAVRHAAATGDQEFLGDIIEAVNPLLLGMREGFPRLRQIVRLIPGTLARQRPMIGYACVHSYIKAGRLKEAQELFDALEGSTPNAAAGVVLSPLVFERAHCHYMLAVYKGTTITERDIEALELFASAHPSLAPFFWSLAETLRSFVQQQASQFAQAKASARRAIGHAENMDSPYNSFYMCCDLGMMSGLEGQVSEAFELFDQVNAACFATVRLDERLTSIRDVFRVELEHEIDPGNAARCARLKNICVRLPTLEGWLDVYAAAYRTYSEQLYLSGDLEAALAILGVGVDHLKKQEIEGAPAVLIAHRSMLLSLAGREFEALEELERLATQLVHPEDLISRPWRIVEALVEAQAACDLASGRSGSLELLSNAIVRAESSGNLRSEIRFRRLRVAMTQLVESEPVVHNDLTRLAVLEGASGFTRSKRLYARRNALYVPQDRRETAPSVVDPTARRQPDYFTIREREVISRLERGLSDKGIAADLGITAHGVRYHLKRIYGKLNAADRREAREKAGRLRIV